MFVVFVGGILEVNCGSFRVIILVEVSVDFLLCDELCTGYANLWTLLTCLELL